MMPSPFPGMNPYFESPALWEDFHQSLAAEIRDQLAPKLRPKYYAALTPRVTYEEVLIQAKPQDAKPDVGVWRQTSNRPLAATSTAVLAPPPIVETIAQQLPLKLWTVEIREVGLGTLVTSIEILSPFNKRPGHEAFIAHQRKRTDLMRAGVNLLEIDLLRSGRRWSLPDKQLPDAPYFIFLWRVLDPKALGIWPLNLREPIPLLPVPLLDPDPDVPLNLTLAIHTIYARAGYDLRIDYTQRPPKPDFSDEDAQWIRDVVATAT